MTSPPSSKKARIDVELPQDLAKIINSQFLKSFAINDFAKQYSSSTPFHHGVIANMFDPQFLMAVKAELLCEKYKPKKNDLYEFQQTDDLKGAVALEDPDSALGQLRSFLSSAYFITIMEKITGLALKKDVIDMAGLRFSDGCRLLAHDDDVADEKSGRRIAYILYFVPKSWSLDDGGTLDLFACDDNHQPVSIARSLLPSFGSFAFFGVTQDSWHQVSEVTSRHERVSISGWLYGDPQSRVPEVMTPSATFIEAIPATESAFEEWINPIYLKSTSLNGINALFVNNSSVLLQDFLLPTKYIALCQAIANSGLKPTKETSPQNVNKNKLLNWETVGPYSRCHYQRGLTIDTSTEVSLPLLSSDNDIVEEFFAFFRSEAMTSFIHTASNVVVTGVSGEMRAFFEGDYTLVHDRCTTESGIDATLYFLPFSEDKDKKKFPSADTSGSVGGETVYLEEDEDEELLSVFPEGNSLSFICRDSGTMKFVSYVTHHAKREGIVDLSMFYEYADGDDGDDDDDDDGEEGDEGDGGDDGSRKDDVIKENEDNSNN